MHFQEWWTRYRATLPAVAFRQRNLATARPAPGVVEAIVGADVVLIAPSNPVVSIGTILSIPGIREALAETHAPVVGVSPIIGGKVVRGMADACLPAIGVETTAAAVGRPAACSTAGSSTRRMPGRRRRWRHPGWPWHPYPSGCATSRPRPPSPGRRWISPAPSAAERMSVGRAMLGRCC